MPFEGGSVSAWLEGLKVGDPAAVEGLWARYFESLVRFARARLGASPRGVADEEDAALSAFESLCRGAARGQFPRLGDRDDLWRVLAVITARKALDQAGRERRQKRGGGRIAVTSGLREGAGGEGDLAGVACPRPTPEFAAMMADECRRRFDDLRDDHLRQVARLRIDGYTNEEVADKLGCSLRTVARKVELIRRTWLGGETIGS